MGRTIVITSGKGGVGKTSITASLGGALAMLGQRVVIMDVDIGLNNLDVVMGIENKVVYDLLDVVEGRCRPKQALVQDGKIPSLYIMPSFHSYERTRIDGSQIKYVADSLSQLFDYVLIDCPAGIELGFHRAVAASSEALVVVTPQISSIRDADKVLSILKSYELNSVGVIINRVRGDLVLSGDMMSVYDIASLLKVSPIGVVPDSDDMSLMSFPKGILTTNSEISKAFSILADNILNGKKNIYDCTLKYRGFLGGIKKEPKKEGVMKKCIVDYARVKNVLLNDKIASPTRLNDCILADVYEMLSNYMEIKKEDIEVKLNLDGGEPSICIKSSFNRLKTFLSV